MPMTSRTLCLYALKVDYMNRQTPSDGCMLITIQLRCCGVCAKVVPLHALKYLEVVLVKAQAMCARLELLLSITIKLEGVSCTVTDCWHSGTSRGSFTGLWADALSGLVSLASGHCLLPVRAPTNPIVPNLTCALLAQCYDVPDLYARNRPYLLLALPTGLPWIHPHEPGFKKTDS